MKTIPIIFTSKGTEYSGELTKVQGAAASSVYYLMIGKYYKGRLRVSAFDERWVFDGYFENLAEGFGSFVLLLEWIKTDKDLPIQFFEIEPIF
jgi:hypothetical protein